MASTVSQQTKWVGAIHEGIPCKRKDLDACIRFYQEVLSLKLLPRPSAKLDQIVGYSPSGAWLGDEDNKVQFHLIAKDDELIPGPDAPASPTARHTAWMVQSLDALRARLREQGVKYSQIDGVVNSDQVFVQDPSGFTWEFQEPR